MKQVFLAVLLMPILLLSAQETKEKRELYFPREELKVTQLPAKEKMWVFIMAGQSNMAGRGRVEPQDTLPNSRILTINSSNEIIVAKEPITFYTPDYRGLGCGLAFAKELLTLVPDDVSILLLPTAVGGSPIHKWIADSPHRNVLLFTNFIEKVHIGGQQGEIKAIVWHQGESDANEQGIASRKKDLKVLFKAFRHEVGNQHLPILVGELGAFSNNPEKWAAINAQSHRYVKTDRYAAMVHTADLPEKGDHVHFNGVAQREMGKRFAQMYSSRFFHP